MKIQSLAIIFIIIILPISLVLSSYTKTRVETLSLQAEYDTKLDSATFDALKAYQVNSYQNKTGDFTNSKIRDINASVNTFFTSMSSNFASLGYTKETLQNYVPAIVYTMYDGYYVYAPYENTWDINSQVNPNQDISAEMSEQIKPDTQTKYKEYTQSDTPSNTETREKLYGLKPYVYYSCRYKNDGLGIDVVITYSLDNYIQIQGQVTENGAKKAISIYGYLLNNLTTATDNYAVYDGVTIGTENNIVERAYYTDQTDGTLKEIETNCIKRGGTKYYAIGSEVYYIFNGKLVQQTINGGNVNNTISAISQDENVNDLNLTNTQNNNNAIRYYKESYDLMQNMKKYKIDQLTEKDIVNTETGNNYTDSERNSTNYPFNRLTGYIFDFNNGKTDGIEAEDSNFNTHRRDVIKKSIEENLAIVIKNFDSSVDTEYRLPKLKETDWDKIMDNIGIITFMQGVNIGGKVYNGYSIVSNDKNEDMISYDSLYIKTKDNVCHRITEDFSMTNTDLTGAVGILNINTERRAKDESNATTGGYYFPVYSTFSYDSIVTQNKVFKNNDQTMKSYVDGLGNDLKTIIYTTLARERYGIYRSKLKID